MFKGKENSNTKAYKDEVTQFPKGLYMIYNEKVYVNNENLKS